MPPVLRKKRSSVRRRGRLHAVVLAGGAGERFWPASRQKHPKPFLEVIDGKSLLDVTLARARRFSDADCVWVVCGKDHARAVRSATGLSADRVLVEPHRRNTAMAIGFAAERIRRTDPDAVLAILPADHHIPDSKAFARAIRASAAAAQESEVLVTLGVKPTRPDTGYGYIQLGPSAGSAHGRFARVKRFVEKPNAGSARRYLRHGGYLWNAGIFVWTARTILSEIEACAPDVHRALAPIREGALRMPRAVLERAYRRAPSHPIDIAVLERSRRVWTLPVAFAWSDVGTWESLACELGVKPGRSRVSTTAAAISCGRGRDRWCCSESKGSQWSIPATRYWS
jgi:mannose-1-phosphate guanylyltransferase